MVTKKELLKKILAELQVINYNSANEVCQSDECNYEVREWEPGYDGPYCRTCHETKFRGYYKNVEFE